MAGRFITTQADAILAAGSCSFDMGFGFYFSSVHDTILVHTCLLSLFLNPMNSTIKIQASRHYSVC